MGLSWHSENLYVLLFHSSGQEEAFYTTTTTLPCSMMLDAPEWAHWNHWNQPLKQRTPFPQAFHQWAPSNSSVSLWDTKCKSGGLIQTSNYSAPENTKWEQSQPSASPRHWETCCHSRERTAIERLLQQTQLFTWENAIAWHSVFWPRLLPVLLFGHVQPGVSPDGSRQGRFAGRAVTHNRIVIFKLFLLQPDAGRPFFPGGQPLLPKAWCAGKPNPTCSILFSAMGGKWSQNPIFKPEGHFLCSWS